MPVTYADIADIRGRGVTPDVADDAAVTAALERATSMVDIFAERDFLKREETYFIDGNGTESIFVDDRPVVEVLELKVDDFLIPTEDYVLYPDAGYIRMKTLRRNIFAGFPGNFARGEQNVEVHGFFGFEAVPAEVKEATILLAMEFLRTAAADADIAAGSGGSTRRAIGIKRVKIDEIAVDFEYPRDIRAGAGRAISTGLLKADGLLLRFRRQLHPIAI